MGHMKILKVKKFTIVIRTSKKLEKPFGFSIRFKWRKRVIKYWIDWFSISKSIFDLPLLCHTHRNIIVWIITNTFIKYNLRSIRKQLKFNFYVTLLTLSRMLFYKTSFIVWQRWKSNPYYILVCYVFLSWKSYYCIILEYKW